jgi:hypothetical protein
VKLNSVNAALCSFAMRNNKHYLSEVMIVFITLTCPSVEIHLYNPQLLVAT